MRHKSGTTNPIEIAKSALKPKDLVGMPWRVAFALQADGWWLRAENIWAKDNPMPESVRDRTTRAHEQVFLLVKNGANAIYWTHREKEGTRIRPAPDYRFVDRLKKVEYLARPAEWTKEEIPCPDCEATGSVDGWFGGEECETCKGKGRVRRWGRINLWKGHPYFYDADAVREANSPNKPWGANTREGAWKELSLGHGVSSHRTMDMSRSERIERYHLHGRNLRSVWTIPTQPYPEAHFATFPKKLVEPCIKAGTSEMGCCATCGAPWDRVVEAKTRFEGGSGRAGRSPDEVGDKWKDSRYGKNILLGPIRDVKTIGFRPTCDHTGEPVPCVVLDPFAGSGTVGEVARSLGRSAILIEIKSEYVEMIQVRAPFLTPLEAYGGGP